MSNHPELPCFKPIIRLKLKGAEDPYPNNLPFIDKDFIYLYASTSEKDYLQDPLKKKAWKEGEIKSPEMWWIAYMKKGYHPNFQKVKDLCGKALPEPVAALYHPVWQLRIAFNAPIGNLIEDAKFQWSFHWFKKTGQYKATTVSYLN